MAGPNAPYTSLDAQQVIRQVFNTATDRLRVDAAVSISPGDIVISHLDDSIRLGDGVDFLTSTTLGLKRSLDVNVSNQLEVTPTGLKVSYKVTRQIITDTPTYIPAVPLTNRNGASIRVLNAATMWIIDSFSKTFADGYPKYQLEEMQLDIQNTIQLIACCAPGQSTEIAIIEVA